jgi:RNA polymerase sigma factor (sigma-70 family)
MLKAIHAGEDIAAAREKAIRVIEKLRGLRLSRAAELVEAAVEETLAYYTFPEEHWRRIRTNNPLERILREIRRRTRVVGAFPDGQSALNLAAARLRHIAARRRRTDGAELDEKIEATIADPANDPEVALQEKDRRELVRRALMRLSPEHREVIDLVYYHEKSVDEVAHILDVPPATVKTRMFYARKKLAELVNGAEKVRC